jgi:GWxTD domain-containing protein
MPALDSSNREPVLLLGSEWHGRPPVEYHAQDARATSERSISMFGHTTLRTAIIIAAALTASPLFAQPGSDPQDKPRKIRREPDKAFVEWLRDVDAIITSSERDAWNKLKTNEEREQFIGEFWRLRDPDPDTDENEYREAYYERLAYANEHFSSGIPGYKTDRGRIYLKYGKPDETESHPSGGSYQRSYLEGGGSTATYPFERWWYRHLPGRADVEIEFIDPTGSGEYRIARNPFEKESMLTVTGTGQTLDGRSQADRLMAARRFWQSVLRQRKGWRV